MRGEIDFARPEAPAGAVWNPDQICWVLLDGLFHNREELRSCLDGVSRIDADSSDEELLLAGYLRWGTEVLDRLVGDFAFVLWDEREHRLLAATDPFGARSLCYVAKNGRLAFGSHTTDLWRLPWVGDNLDEVSVVAFLIDSEPEPERTYYAEILRLPGGHLLSASAKAVEVRRYWGPPFAPDGDIRTQADLLERFRELFERVVAERLGTGEPAAILMSGGFDSTAVAGVAGALWREKSAELPPIRIISSVFEDLPCDERSRIERCLETLPFAADLISPLGRGVSVEGLVEDAALHDGPFLSLQRPTFEDAYKAARAHGVEVVLTGLGGDELAIDFDYEVDALRAAGVWGAVGAVRRIATIEGESVGRIVRRLARNASPEWVKRSYRWVRQGGARQSAAVPEAWLAPEILPQVKRFQRAPRPVPVGLDSHSSEVRWQLVDSHEVQTAVSWWTRAFQARDLRVTSPFFDRRLFDLVLGTPSRLHPRSFPTGEYKPLISKGLGGYVPPEITAGFWKATFDCYNMHVLGLSSKSLYGYLFGEDWRAERFVSRVRALELLEEYERQGATNQLLHRIEQVLGLEVWLRTREVSE